MPSVITNTGKAEMLARVLNYTDDLIIHLFINDVTLSVNNILSDFTEMTAADYASIKLDQNWSITNDTASYVEVSFDVTEAATAYGFYITDESETILLWAEKYDTPETVGAGGGSFLITPEMVIS